MSKKIARFLLLFLLSFVITYSYFTPVPQFIATILHAPRSTIAPSPTALPQITPVSTTELAGYTLNTIVDYDAHIVTVDEIIRYPNHTGKQLDSIVLAVVPNLWADSFDLQSISIDGAPVTAYALEGQRLVIALSSLLQPESVLTINIHFTLTLPFAVQEDPKVSRPRIYGYTDRQLNLVDWYPFVVPYINGEWILHDPWYYGEHLVYDSADYEVNLKFADPATAPVVAASGFSEQLADSTRYTITSARTFALSASREFQVQSSQFEGISVISYYFAINETAGLAALQASVDAIRVFNQRYGAYQHKTLSIVMGDFNDGMEYSAFFFLPRDFYNLYDGTPANYLTFVAVHETSHQWWFEQVASDQALQPWVDESLATYSERIYYESTHPDLVGWWWTYRIDFYKPQGFVDIPIYEGQGFRPYTNAAYFQGAHFLEDLRTRIGDEAFFAFLQDYLTQSRGKIVTTADFFHFLREHTSTDISDLILQYFQNVY
jgi:hypothetical protein